VRFFLFLGTDTLEVVGAGATTVEMERGVTVVEGGGSGSVGPSESRWVFEEDVCGADGGSAGGTGGESVGGQDKGTPVGVAAAWEAV
jgi:hypothetical protein